MADKTIQVRDNLTNSLINIRVRDNGDGSYSQVVDIAGLFAGENLVDKVLGIHNKPVSGQTYAPLRYLPATNNVSKDYIKPSPGNLIRFSLIRLDTSGLLYLQFFNRTSAPTAALAALFQEPIEPAADATHPTRIRLGAEYFTDGGDWFTTGIAWGISSTKDTFTDAGSGTNYIIKANYI